MADHIKILKFNGIWTGAAAVRLWPKHAMRLELREATATR